MASKKLSNRTIQVEIANVRGQVYSGTCHSAVAPASQGEICILPLHAPLISRLNPGEVRLHTAEDTYLLFYVSGGFLEVQPHLVTVLADESLRAEEIDRDAALEAKRHAEQVLLKSPLFSERDQARAELLKALAQLRLVDQLRNERQRSR